MRVDSSAVATTIFLEEYPAADPTTIIEAAIFAQAVCDEQGAPHALCPPRQLRSLKVQTKDSVPEYNRGGHQYELPHAN